GSRADAHGEEKELSFRAENRQRPRDRSIDRIHTLAACHAPLPREYLKTAPHSRKEPGEEVDSGDGHADAEKHACEHSLRAAFSEGEREAGYHDGHQRSEEHTSELQS